MHRSSQIVFLCIDLPRLCFSMHRSSKIVFLFIYLPIFCFSMHRSSWIMIHYAQIFLDYVFFYAHIFLDYVFSMYRSSQIMLFSMHRSSQIMFFLVYLPDKIQKAPLTSFNLIKYLACLHLIDLIILNIDQVNDMNYEVTHCDALSSTYYHHIEVHFYWLLIMFSRTYSLRSYFSKRSLSQLYNRTGNIIVYNNIYIR